MATKRKRSGSLWKCATLLYSGDWVEKKVLSKEESAENRAEMYEEEEEEEERGL